MNNIEQISLLIAICFVGLIIAVIVNKKNASNVVGFAVFSMIFGVFMYVLSIFGGEISKRKSLENQKRMYDNHIIAGELYIETTYEVVTNDSGDTLSISAIKKVILVKP